MLLDPLVQDAPHQYEKVGRCGGMKALLKADLTSKVFARQVVCLFFIILCVFAQETIGVFWLTHFNQPTLNYSKVSSIFYK